MKRQFNLLLHPAFIFSLFLLLLNDISLKYQFANTFTGKLSDFTGLFVFALFWMAFFPSNKKSITLIIAILFTWWKSPLSTTFIDWWNREIFFSVSRVIDYSDLFALSVLPIAMIIAEKNADPVTKYRRIFIPLIGCITIFSFCFTSAYRYGYYHYADNEVAYNYDVKTKLTEQQILQQLRQQNISYSIDSISYYPAREYRWNASYVMRVKSPGADSVKWVPIENRADSMLYIRLNEGTYYVIPKYRVDDIEMENVKIFISSTNGGKYSRIHIDRFLWEKRAGDFTGKIRRKLNRHFKKLFDK
ncbi:MAG: hypothetical protein ABW007_10570 [Chitinophagaceae bacterium]